MTDATEILPNPTGKPAKPAKAKAAEGYKANPYAGVIMDGAIISWLAGIGLGRGFGVHVPFIAGWLLVTGFLILVFSVASNASAAHHHQAVKAAQHIAYADTIGEAAGQAVLDAQGFLDMDKKLREHPDKGFYQQ